MKHGAMCSRKKPLKNTCAAALSARDLLWCDEAEERRAGHGHIVLAPRFVPELKKKASNCTLRALDCGVWWCCSTETERGKRKSRLTSYVSDWEQNSWLPPWLSINLKLKKKKKDKKILMIHEDVQMCNTVLGFLKLIFPFWAKPEFREISQNSQIRGLWLAQTWH